MTSLIGQRLVENAKIKRFKCDILITFQTMYRRSSDQTESLIMLELCAEFVYFRYSLINHQVTRSYCQTVKMPLDTKMRSKSEIVINLQDSSSANSLFDDISRVASLFALLSPLSIIIMSREGS